MTNPTEPECAKCMISTQALSPFDRRGADTLAVEVRKLIIRNVIDARSPAGDALIDYCDTDDRRREVDTRARRELEALPIECRHHYVVVSGGMRCIKCYKDMEKD